MAARPWDPWKYPFRGEGLILLGSGTVFLALADILQRFLLFLSVAVSIFVTGYLIAYSQKIITSTANADYQPPTWPDFSDFHHDILSPFIQALGVYLIYFLPFTLARWFLPESEILRLALPAASVAVPLLLVPMAWLALAMHDNIVALSPHFVIPSILRVPASYLGMVGQIVLLGTAIVAVAWALDRLPIPIIPALLSSFMGLYGLMVGSRLLGIFYYKNRSRLGWFE